MRFSTTLLALATAVSANPLNTFRSEKQSLVRRDDLQIPGDNPLKYCDADRGDDIITIEKVDLSPNPPEAYVYQNQMSIIST